MPDRRLIVGEFDPTSADVGKLFAIDPLDTAGVAVPTFQVGNGRPRAGSVVGETYFDTNQRQGFVWTGVSWQGIAPNPIMTFHTEAELLRDLTPQPGTYATAGDSGSLFIKTPGGWRQVGIKPYATAADLFNDSVASVGSLGEVMDEDSLWEKTAAGWRLMLIREMADTAAITAWTNASPGATVGDRVVDKLHSVSYIRSTTGWKPVTIWEDTEANIRAATWALNGQEAIATDTGRTFVRIGGVWREEPIQHYATEAELLAADVPAGTMAWADDTNNVFARVGTRWIGTNTGFYDPTPIGTISAFPVNTVPSGWLLCDGATIPAGTEYDALRALLGTTTVPDLRGQFLRGAATAADALLAKHQWTTGMPRNHLTTSYTGAHTHTFQLGRYGGAGGSDVNNYNPGGGKDGTTETTVSSGLHEHVISGGDTETAPDHVKINWCIKAKFATLVPANSLRLNLTQTTKDGDLLSYDGATASWRGRQWLAVDATAPVSPQKGFNWYNPAEKTLSVFDGSKWMGVYGQIKNIFQGSVTLGANAATENDIILLKKIAPNNGSLYISLGDEYYQAARSSYELHALLSTAADAKLIPIHIDATTNYLYNLRIVWIDQTDKYALVARVAAGNAGVTYRVGLFSANSDLSSVVIDGNTLCTSSGGPKVDVRSSYPPPPRVQRLWSEDTAANGPLHKLSLEPVKRYVKLDGSAWADENYTVRPYLEFAGTEFDLFATANIFHVFAFDRYKDGGVQDSGDTFIRNHGCGLTFKHVPNHTVKKDTLISFRITVHRRGGGYWDIWQESFFGSENDTPMHMDAKYQIKVTGEMTAIGFRCFDWTGGTAINSQHALQVEAM